jgi:AhpD family alkylhydroperoxidase
MPLTPDVFKALVRLDTAAKKRLPESLINLIKVRASQLNHCAFCLDMHSEDAFAAGGSTEQIIHTSAVTKFTSMPVEHDGSDAARRPHEPPQRCRGPVVSWSGYWRHDR